MVWARFALSSDMHFTTRRDIGFEFGIAQIAEFDRHQIPLHAQHGRHTDRQVQVRAALSHP